MRQADCSSPSAKFRSKENVYCSRVDYRHMSAFTQNAMGTWSRDMFHGLMKRVVYLAVSEMRCVSRKSLKHGLLPDNTLSKLSIERSNATTLLSPRNGRLRQGVRDSSLTSKTATWRPPDETQLQLFAVLNACKNPVYETKRIISNIWTFIWTCNRDSQSATCFPIWSL